MSPEQIQFNKQCREEAEEMMAFIGERPLRFWEVLAGLIAAKRTMLASGGCDSCVSGSVGDKQPVPRLVEVKSPRTAAAPASQIRTTAGVTIPIEPRTSNARRVMEALELCDDINQLCNEMPMAGFDFSESVREGAAEVKKTIEATQRVTEAQMRAIDNWISGLRAWVRE